MAISKDLGRQHKPVVGAPAARGGAFSLGDISMLAIVHRIFELYPDRLERDAFPRINDWWDCAMKRPAAEYRLLGAAPTRRRRGLQPSRSRKIEDYRDVMRRRADGYAASTVASMASAANASRKALVHGPIIQGR